MLVFGRVLPIWGLGDLQVAMGFAAGLDGEGFGWVTGLGAPVGLTRCSCWPYRKLHRGG
jgi:hypothetical protein